jgi:hypothetical protein
MRSRLEEFGDSVLGDGAKVCRLVEFNKVRERQAEAGPSVEHGLDCAEQSRTDAATLQVAPDSHPAKDEMTLLVTDSEGTGSLRAQLSNHDDVRHGDRRGIAFCSVKRSDLGVLSLAGEAHHHIDHEVGLV